MSEDAREETLRILRAAKQHLELAMKSVAEGKPVSEVRNCFARVRDCLSDTQEYLRAIAKRQKGR